MGRKVAGRSPGNHSRLWNKGESVEFAAFLHGMGSGWAIDRVAAFANRVGALVASRAGGTPRWTLAEALALEGLA